MGLYLDNGLMVLNKITSQKTGFIKTTDHRPTDPPTTFHLPTNPSTNDTRIGRHQLTLKQKTRF